ncbi:VAMP-associated protein [Moesziomyces antarcticus T-34]|uniref:VAMP-associated protein n=1 Tax=Pseudozyma antarctica (strain T-34) TaxID=1151754 RepID=M9MI14_PSEA3|nr:VAMP-associated protein [Moesziomyces antarcticus T-34]
MSVELSPHVQLGFPLFADLCLPALFLRTGPLTQLVKRTLTVSNPNNQPVAFKVKTTAPKQYCVRPNSGRIEPGEKVEVQVLLQPMKEEPPSSAKCRDKFLVQSTIITPDFETASLQEIWPVIEKENKSAIHEQKIRCAYLPATTAPLQEEDEGNTSQLNGDERYTTAEVARLRKELDQAKRAGGSGNTQVASADGVPVHIVAAIAFAVFAITYVMF